MDKESTPNEKKIDTTALLSGEYTYKKLCGILNEPIKAGNAKVIQLKEWLRYFDYEKSGTKFTVYEVYETPLEKEYKYPSNAIYIKYIEVLLLGLLASTEGNRLKITPQGLYKSFGMINENYVKIHRLEKEDRVNAIKEDLKNMDAEDVCIYMTDFEVHNFFFRCKNKFSKIIKGAFDSLQKRMLIKYVEEYEYCVYEKEDYFDTRHNPKMVLRSYIAKGDDIEYILKVKRETLLKYGCEDEQEIHFKKKEQPYYNEINRRVKEERNWTHLYKVYAINYCRDTALEALQHDQIRLQKYGLNAALIEYMNKQAQSNYKKTKDIPWNAGEFKYPDSYVGMQEVLSYQLLNIDRDREKPQLLKKDNLEVFSEDEIDMFATD